jgi:hypothetical protein
MNYSIRLLALLTPLLWGTCSAQLPATPRAISSDSFTTLDAGFVAELDAKRGPKVSYAISYKITKPFDRSVFAEVSFQNPGGNPAEVKLIRPISADEATILLVSPPVQLPMPADLYNVVLRVYSDESRQMLLAEHVQPVQAPVESQSALLGRLYSEVRKTPKFWSMDLAAERWEVGYAKSSAKQEITEHVPEGQTVENWREILTEHNFYAAVDPRVAAHLFIRDMKNKFPSFQVNVLQQSEERVLIEWSQTDATGYGPEHALFLYQAHSRGLHVLQYSHKGPKMDTDLRQRWLDRLLAARLMYTTR